MTSFINQQKLVLWNSMTFCCDNLNNRLLVRLVSCMYCTLVPDEKNQKRVHMGRSKFLLRPLRGSLRICQGVQDPDSKVHGANMWPIWGRQDPGGPHVGPMNSALRGVIRSLDLLVKLMSLVCSLCQYHIWPVKILHPLSFCSTM